MNRCPIKRSSCTQIECKRYDCGSWFCVGLKERKSPRGAKMDVVKLCGNTHFAKRECFLQCTPDEAARIAGLLAKASADWLDDSEHYQVFIAENDK